MARLRPSALPSLVRQGRLSIDEAWANIQLLPDPETQSEALTSLSEIAPDDRADEIEAAALASLQRIEGDYLAALGAGPVRPPAAPHPS